MDLKKIIDSLSPIERRVLPNLSESDFDKMEKSSGLDRVSVLRALEFLSSKNIIQLKLSKKKIVDFGVNGIYYQKKGLPERNLLIFLEKGIFSLEEAQKKTGLNENEFKAALGALKKRALIDIKHGKLHLTADRKELTKKSLEEQFLDKLPLEYDSLAPEDLFSLKSLQGRKNIIEIVEKQIVSYELTKLGKDLLKEDFGNEELLEELTTDMIRNGKWKGKKFRRYDVISKVPEISGGKVHFVNQSLSYVRKVWSDLGFQEMAGNLIQESFWNFDALFTAQDHPVREMQDTFFINSKLELEDRDIVKKIKETHEKGVDNSKGWQYLWNEEESKKMVLRTHTTCLSARKLYELSKLPVKKRKGKFFSLGKNFRNETVDWSHGFEFYQTEGIVIDPDVNFRHLLGYLNEFYLKMGFEKVRFRPGYFPYTEPSVEVEVFHPGKKCWIELGGAGIFRPEITIPLLGVKTPVLAWGQGFDRIIMDYYKIEDLREMYKNDIKQLRKMRFWVK
ncbi:MAG: phenylalanine--tRNA ligase subunit alpha [Candidatus Pacearchaeota archaeon]